MTYIQFFRGRFEELIKEHKRKNLLICIDGITGAGKSDAARFLQEELAKFGVRLQIKEAGQFTRTIAKNLGYANLDEFAEARRRNKKLAEQFDIKLDNELLEHGIKNGGIIVSRLAISVLGNEPDAKVFATADAGKIAKRLSIDKNREEHGKPLEEIKRRIQNRTKHDIETYEDLYNIDYMKTETKNAVVIHNNGTLEDLREEMRKIAKALIAKH